MQTHMTNKIEETVRVYKQKGKSPFCAYIYDLEKLKEHTKYMQRTLPARCRLFYAIKANSEQPVLQALREIVNGFEVASIGEIEAVREVDSSISVCFGGPGKTDEELECAIHQNIELIHVESLHELRRLHTIAQRLQRTVSILLRVNLENIQSDATLKMAGVPTQFGIEEKQIPQMMEEIKGLPCIELKGFHFHAMSNNLDALAHVEFIHHCLQQVKGWEQQGEITVEHVNVGGGIGIDYARPGRTFDWELFVRELEGVLQTSSFPYTLTFEPGRYITAMSGYYAAEVLDIKENHGKHFAVVRGGTHHLRLPAAWKMSHPFTVIPMEEWPYPFERPEVQKMNLTVAGELCTPNDVLVRDTYVERVRAGDILLFSHAGAYGWVISHHDFLQHPHPEKIFLM